MTPDETYNGWTNRETWAFNLHFGYDESLAELANDVYTESLERSRECPSNDHWPEEWHLAIALSDAADAVENWYDETIEEFSGDEGVRSAMQDIGSVWRVNFREIAEYLAPIARDA